MNIIDIIIILFLILGAYIGFKQGFTKSLVSFLGILFVAIIAYFLYTIIIIGLYYISFYKKLLKLNRWNLFKCFAKPTLIGAIVFLIVSFVPIRIEHFGEMNQRFAYILICFVKSILWLIPYIILLIVFKIIDLRKVIRSHGNM